MLNCIIKISIKRRRFFGNQEKWYNRAIETGGLSVNEEELEKEQIFKELQAEIRAGIEAYERGECIPLEDVIAQLSRDR